MYKREDIRAGRRWAHPKTGRTYVTCALALNGTNGKANGQVMVRYCREEHYDPTVNGSCPGGGDYVREASEFLDGRFIPQPR